MDRKQSESILREQSDGTFILRLASGGGLALSFRQQKIKHVTLRWKAQNQYEIKRADKETVEVDTLSNIIRTYDKIRLLYTPNLLIDKRKVFS